MPRGARGSIASEYLGLWSGRDRLLPGKSALAFSKRDLFRFGPGEPAVRRVCDVDPDFERAALLKGRPVRALRHDGEAYLASRCRLVDRLHAFAGCHQCAGMRNTHDKRRLPRCEVMDDTDEAEPIRWRIDADAAHAGGAGGAGDEALVDAGSIELGAADRPVDIVAPVHVVERNGKAAGVVSASDEVPVGVRTIDVGAADVVVAVVDPVDVLAVDVDPVAWLGGVGDEVLSLRRSPSGLTRADSVLETVTLRFRSAGSATCVWRA
jgi:hypothetical protein